MARSFLTPINMNQLQILNLQLQNLGAAPSSPVAGQVYYDTGALTGYIWNGSAMRPTDAAKLTDGSIQISALATNPLQRANQTGTQPSSTISDLSTVVQGYHLNSFAVPTANIAMGGYTLTGLATPSAAGQAATYDWTLARPLSAFATPTANIVMGGYTLTGLGSPSAAGQAATYDWTLSRPLNAFAVPTASIAMAGFTFTGLPAPTGPGQPAEYSWTISQIQSAAAGIASKDPVATVYTSNVATLSGFIANDGYTPVAGDRLLLTAQSTSSQNGVYTAASGTWARTTIDGAGNGEIVPGSTWLVLNGTANAGSSWRVNTTGTITVGTTAISIVMANVQTTYTASNGVQLSNNTFSAQVIAGGGVLASASGLSVDTTVVTRKYAVTIGDGSSTSYTVTHNLNTQDVLVQVKQTANPYSVVEVDMAATTVNTATITFASAPAASSYRVVVMG